MLSGLFTGDFTGIIQAEAIFCINPGFPEFFSKHTFNDTKAICF